MTDSVTHLSSRRLRRKGLHHLRKFWHHKIKAQDLSKYESGYQWHTDYCRHHFDNWELCKAELQRRGLHV